MNNIYAITTHHEKYQEAAEAWKECGVCSIGFFTKDRKNLRQQNKENFNKEIRDFLQIEKDDLVLAYAPANTIAYVGEVVDGKTLYNEHNSVGRDFRHPHQLRIRYWEEPNHFRRSDLPPSLSQQLGKRGKTVIRLSLGDMGFAQVVAIIKACAVSGSGGSALNEDMIKAGLSNYIKQHLDFLDKGLKIIQSEVQISPESRPDFIAKDSSGRKVLVECKREGTASATDQLLRYNKAYGGKTRMFLVAFHFDDECMKSAKKRGIETIQATIVPKRLF